MRDGVSVHAMRRMVGAAAVVTALVLVVSASDAQQTSGSWAWNGRHWVWVPSQTYVAPDPRVTAYQACRTRVSNVLSEIRTGINNCAANRSQCASTATTAGDDMEATMLKCAMGWVANVATSGATTPFAGEVLGHPCIALAKAAVDGAFSQNSQCNVTCDATQITTNVFSKYQITDLPHCGGVIQVSISTSSSPGALIQRVMPGGPASRAGLVPGDRIVAVGGVPIPDGQTFLTTMEGTVPGNTFQVEFLRGGTRYQTQVTTTTANAQVSAQLLAPQTP
jgi:membrane-associated protease RseP (regulator of RpoE activity)